MSHKLPLYVWVCVHTAKKWKALAADLTDGVCVYVCERKKNGCFSFGEGRRGMVWCWSLPLSWHENEITLLQGFWSLLNADGAVRLSFDNQSAGRLGPVGNPPPPISLPSPLTSPPSPCGICDLHCGSDDRKALTIILSPLFSSSPPPAAPRPSDTSTATVSCHQKTSAVSECQSTGFHSARSSRSGFHIVFWMVIRSERHWDVRAQTHAQRLELELIPAGYFSQPLPLAHLCHPFIHKFTIDTVGQLHIHQSFNQHPWGSSVKWMKWVELESRTEWAWL